uniref:Folylpolyglutamate synthase n=1 Tax=Anolis carolinensis TaxID=28377 RepID=A0A803TCN2_ANOCA
NSQAQWHHRGATSPSNRGHFTIPGEPLHPATDAIRTLNSLQTNASYLDQVKRTRGDPQAQLSAMDTFLLRTGIQVRDLDQLNIIHVTGTKGKGSACAFTERILRNYGLKTGFYSSPHLVQVRERIRINGQPISKELFSKYFWQVYNRLEETKDSHGAAMPAYFRFLTIMAFHVFLQEKVDLAVLEVGIGGAYDCTNIIRKPVVCGVSALGIDHTSILGDTIEKIAWQKGGIFKPGVPAFTVPQLDRPLDVLKERAQKISCPLWVCPDLGAFEEGGRPLRLGLAGDHQRSNAALALQLCRAWLHRHTHLDVAELNEPWTDSKRPPGRAHPHSVSAWPPGLQDTEWLGRNQVLHHGPVTWYIDGAHTTSSIQACVRWFRQAARIGKMPADGSEVRVLIFNVTGDRDTAAFLKLLVPCQFDYAVFCPNFTEVSTVGNADQQNFNVTLEHVLTRCLQNQHQWQRLTETGVDSDLWPLDPLGETPLPPPGTSTRVFPCASQALWWASQGRDPRLATPARRGSHALTTFPRLREAGAIHVLVTGSLHLAGAALNLLDPSLSQ